MKNIAILYICTGEYEQFWDNFYKNCMQNFYPNNNRHFFVFTDSQRLLQLKDNHVSVYYQSKAGWPYDTLLRFHWFLSIQDILMNYDLCYFLNANAIVRKIIDETIIPLPDSNKPLIFWCHSRHVGDNYGNTFHPERNPLSTAYIKPGDYCRCYGGGFFGGISSSFLRMCMELRDNIQKDLNNNIIAIWHDQSHIIKYGASNSNYKEVEFGIISSEEYITNDELCRIVFLNKNKFGGNNNLRKTKNNVFISLLSKIKKYLQIFKS